MSKKVNPYDKKNKKRFHIGRKQWIAILSVLGVIAILAGIIVMSGLGGGVDPHAGHNHGDEGDLPEGHYEGDGHNHGSTSGTGHSNSTAKVTYNVVTNADKTYNLTVRNEKGTPLFTQNNLVGHPVKQEINKEKNIYQLGWATVADVKKSNANTYEALYYNEQTAKVSEVFYAPKACDGVRVAYPSDDQTKIIVQDLFDKTTYCKEYALEGAVRKDTEIVCSDYKLSDDKKAAIITYYIADGKTKTIQIPLYE